MHALNHPSGNADRPIRANPAARKPHVLQLQLVPRFLSAYAGIESHVYLYKCTRSHLRRSSLPSLKLTYSFPNLTGASPPLQTLATTSYYSPERLQDDARGFQRRPPRLHPLQLLFARRARNRRRHGSRRNGRASLCPKRFARLHRLAQRIRVEIYLCAPQFPRSRNMRVHRRGPEEQSGLSRFV